MSSIVSGAFRLEIREETGKGASRELRRKGFVPGELYGADKENVHLAVDARDIEKGLDTTGFYATIYELIVNGKKERALVKEVQLHPMKDHPIHIDFKRVKKGATIEVAVPLNYINEDKSPGIENGGVLNIIHHTLEVSAKIDDIPSALDIDVGALDMGDSISMSAIKLPGGVAFTNPEVDETLVTIVAPTSTPSRATAEEEAAESDEGDTQSAKDA